MSDCYALILPWAMIWPLDMPRRQKLALNMVFSFGIVVVVAAGLRTKHAVALGSDTDSTWVGFWVYFWTMLEWNLAIICNCAPSMRAFFREYLKDTVDKALNSLSSRSKYKSTTKGTLISQQNIELRRTYTVESEKPFNVHGSVRSKDGSTSSVSSQQLASLPQAHSKYSNRNDLSDARGASQFVPNDSAWSNSKTNITCAGPVHVKGPYGEV